MMENDVEKLEKKRQVLQSMLTLHKYLRKEGDYFEALGAINVVSDFVTEVFDEQDSGVKVIHPRQGMRKVSEAKVIKAIDLLSKEWLSMQQLANRVNLSKSSVMTALMPAVRKRATVSRQRMGKMAKTKYRVTSIG